MTDSMLGQSRITDSVVREECDELLSRQSAAAAAAAWEATQLVEQLRATEGDASRRVKALERLAISQRVTSELAILGMERPSLESL